jgi:hypothetical protein
MASDIAINMGVTVYFYYHTGMVTLDRLPLQIAFGIFVFLTSPMAWKTVKGSSRDRPPESRTRRNEKCYKRFKPT